MQTPPKTVAEWVVDSQECAVEMDVRGEREKQVQVKRPTGVSAHMQVKVVYTLKVLFLFFLPHFETLLLDFLHIIFSRVFNYNFVKRNSIFK